MQTYYKPGTWNVICDVCGFQFKSDQIKKRWDGLMVCSDDFEHDHPQKYLRVYTEKSLNVPFIRSDPSDNFVFFCYLFARMSYADIGQADCMLADDTSLSYTYALELKGGL